MTKKEMRKKMLSLRDSLSEKERREKSREIAKRLFTLEEFQKAEVWFCHINHFAQKWKRRK